MNPSHLFVCSFGRAGSTLTMNLLSSHPQVLARRLFPYEARTAQYFFARHSNGHDGVAALEPETYHGGTYRPWPAGDAVGERYAQEFAAGATQQPVAGYYRRVAEEQGAAPPAWIVEKAMGVRLVADFLASHRKARALFLLRDPRDTYLSARAFNRKSAGSAGFGEALGPEAMFRNILAFGRLYARLRPQRRDAVLKMHYENLVAGRARPLERIFEWLELDVVRKNTQRILETAMARDPQVEQHSTTASAPGSVGRWRSEASAEDLELFARHQSAIAALGYGA